MVPDCARGHWLWKARSASLALALQNEGMALTIPGRLASACHTPERAAWLARLPDALRELERRWLLTLGAPLDDKEVSCAWVAPVTAVNGTSAMLKLGMPHIEGEHEIESLHFWDGNPTVRLLQADDDLGAMLLERCEQGTVLRSLPECEQDLMIAGLLRRLWRLPMAPHPFRPLSVMTTHWSNETLALAVMTTHWSNETLALAQMIPGCKLSKLLLEEEGDYGADFDVFCRLDLVTTAAAKCPPNPLRTRFSRTSENIDFVGNHKIGNGTEAVGTDQ
jgi:hypothetical protein